VVARKSRCSSNRNLALDATNNFGLGEALHCQVPNEDNYFHPSLNYIPDTKGPTTALEADANELPYLAENAPNFTHSEILLSEQWPA
jgi:hypothetical protein